MSSAVATHTHDHDHSHDHSHSHEDLSYAGQGPVLLDIGGDVGALIVTMPAEMAGLEIEICPVGEEHSARPRSHVAVIGRPADGETVYSAVFPSVLEGSYELYLKHDGPTEVTATISGGEVSLATWPPG